MGGVSAASELRLTEQQIAELREAFQLFDKDGDGHVTPKELMIVLQSLGQNPTIDMVDEMINEVDTDNNGEIEFEEFCVLMCRNMKENDDIDTLKEAFKLLDSDGSGEISKTELKEILRSFSKLGEDIADDEIDNLIKQADVDGDGQISYDEVRSTGLFEICSCRRLRHRRSPPNLLLLLIRARAVCQGHDGGSTTSSDFGPGVTDEDTLLVVRNWYSARGEEGQA